MKLKRLSTMGPERVLPFFFSSHAIHFLSVGLMGTRRGAPVLDSSMLIRIEPSIRSSLFSMTVFRFPSWVIRFRNPIGRIPAKRERRMKPAGSILKFSSNFVRRKRASGIERTTAAPFFLDDLKLGILAMGFLSVSSSRMAHEKKPERARRELSALVLLVRSANLLRKSLGLAWDTRLPSTLSAKAFTRRLRSLHV